MDVLDASLLAIAAKAARGDLKAMQFLHELRREAQALEPPPADAEIGADDQAILDTYLARRQATTASPKPRRRQSRARRGQPRTPRRRRPDLPTTCRRLRA
jgi:hypothetical protein